MAASSLNRVVTRDGYALELTVAGPMASCTFTVFSQAVVYQEGHGNQPEFSSDEHEIPPGFSVAISHPIDGVRFRSASRGVPGLVTVIPSFEQTR